jgi:hypothetical protein
LLNGRQFTWHDDKDFRVALVNGEFARKNFGSLEKSQAWWKTESTARSQRTLIGQCFFPSCNSFPTRHVWWFARTTIYGGQPAAPLARKKPKSLSPDPFSDAQIVHLDPSAVWPYSAPDRIGGPLTTCRSLVRPSGPMIASRVTEPCACYLHLPCQGAILRSERTGHQVGGLR